MKVHVVKSERHQRRKRVAAYCRVSTMESSQEESYETQKDYYETFIRCHDDWDFAGIYADQGISGTSAEKRPQFMACIKDAIEGKIDLILVKSISRFSRNIVDCQSYVEKLKSYGVEVYFEKENLSTMDPTSGMIFSLMGLIAQSESESISQNVKWAIQERYKKGEYTIGSNQVLGYSRGEDGRPIPNEDAWIIRFIFQKFSDGENIVQISQELENMGVRNRNGKPLSRSTIQYILRNEAYVGDKRLNKITPVNFLTHEKEEKREEIYVKDGHTPIIDRELWDKVQKMLDDRAVPEAAGTRFVAGQSHFLRGRIFCGECGAPYVRRKRPIFKDYKTVGHFYIWKCKTRWDGKNCRNRIIKEDELLKEIEDVCGPIDQSFDGRVTVFQDHIEVAGHGA